MEINGKLGCALLVENTNNGKWETPTMAEWKSMISFGYVFLVENTNNGSEHQQWPEHQQWLNTNNGLIIKNYPIVYRLQ